MRKNKKNIFGRRYRGDDIKCNSKKELLLGMKIEKEHSHLFKNDKNNKTKKITKDHIKEYPCYYSKGLIPMERKLRRMKGGLQ